MKYVFLIAFFGTVSLVGNAQDNEHYLETRGYRNSTYFNPVIVFGFVNPALEFGYIRNFENMLSTKFSASYLFAESVTNRSNDIPRDAKGFRLSLEERFYLERTVKQDRYVGIEFAYLQRDQSVLFRFNPQDPYDSTFYDTGYNDTVRVHRQTYSFNLNFGKQYFYNRAYVEVLFGFGLRYKNIYHTDRINPSDPIEPSKDFNFKNSNNREKKSWGLSLPLAIRVGYIF